MRPVLTRRLRTLAPALLLGALISIGCSEKSEIGPGAVTTVRVDPDTLVLVLGLQDTLQAFPIDQRGYFLPNKPVTWASNAEGVATVDAEGTVSAVGLGMAMVTATADQIQGSAVIQVVPAPVISADQPNVRMQAFGQSGTNPMDTVVISNSGGAVLDQLALGTIQYGPGATGWLTAVLDQPGAPANIELTASVTGLALGSYTATVPVTEPDAVNSPFDITVTLDVVADVATTMAISAGDNQNGTVATAVAVPPSVLVSDQFGNPVAGQPVTFTVATGGGSVTGGSATTNAAGIAAVGSWTLGTATGTNTLTATSTGLAGSPATFTATASAGAATQIAVSTGNGQSATVNTAVAVNPAVLVRDAFSNPVAGVAVTFAVAGGGGAATGTSATTNASGVATVGSWTLGQTAGANTLTATATGLTGSPVTFTATGNAGAATTATITAGNGQTATVNTAVATDPAIIVRDQFSNPVPGVAITWAVTGGGGAVVPGAGATTNAAGSATVTSWTLGTVAGASNNTLSATAAGVTPALTFTASAAAGAATVLAKNAGDNQAANAGQAVTTPPRVLVTDQFGNPVSGVAITFAVASGGGSATGLSQTTNASGLASVGSWTLGNTAGTNTLTAMASGLTTATFTATGNPGNASQMALAGGNGQTGTAGAALATSLSVLVRDALNNPVSGVTVGWATTSGGAMTPASSVTNASGIATTSWTLGTAAGAQSATGSVGGLTGSPVNFSATATPDAAASIAVSAGNGQTATVNTTVATAPAALVTDQFGNPVNGVSVTFAVTGGGGSVTGGSQTTNASGIATVTSWRLGTTAGANSLSAAATGVGTPAGFTATGTAGPATQIAVNAGNAQSATVNTNVAVAPSVLVRDAFNNPVSGVAVAFAVTGGGGSVAGPNQTTNGSGVAAATSWTLGTVAGSNTLSATSAGLSGSPVLFTATGTAGVATTMTLAAGSGQSATVNTSVATNPSVRITDQFGNNVSGTIVSWGRTAGNGTINCGGGATTGCTVTSASVTGLSTLTAWTMGTTAGTNTITATAGGLTGSPVTFNATGNPGSVTTIALNAGDGQTVRPAQSVPIPPSVIARDAFNNSVPGVVVTFTVSAGTGQGLIVCSAVATTSCGVTTNGSGVATLVSWTYSTSGVPTVAQPFGGVYFNGVTAAAGTGSYGFLGAARWSFALDVAPIFTANSLGSCDGCHSAGNFGIYTNIVNRAAVDNPGCGNLVVTTGSLANSFLYQKINWTQAGGCGVTMPQGSLSQLTQSERFRIRDWILNTAPNN